MRALICGAGIAGLALAWWLERDGWQVQLVEQADGPRGEGYMIDFFGSGYDAAARMGLLEALNTIQTPIKEVRYVDAAGRSRGRIDYAGLAATFDERVFTFMRGDLEHVLRQALGCRVPIRYGLTVDAVADHHGGAEVTLSDGTVEQVHLLVGADGIHSRVRRLAFGPQQPLLRYLGCHTASYLFDDPHLAARIGQCAVAVAEPGRQLQVYPVPGGRLAAWLVHRTPDAGLPDDPRAAIMAAYAGMGPIADHALAQLPSAGGLYYDVVAQIELDRWCRGPVTLVGDSCQAVSLMAGQGASLAVAGAYVLAQELRHGGTPTEAAQRYQRRMLPFVRAKQRAGRRTAAWLLPRSHGGITVRAQALRLLDLPGGARLLRPAAGPLRASIVTPD